MKASNNKLKLGQTLKLFGDKPYRIVGIYSPESGSRVKITLAAMQEALESPGKCTYVMVKVQTPISRSRWPNESMRRCRNKIQLTRDLFTSLGRHSLPRRVLRILVGLAAVVSALVVMLAMYTTITERTREIGILKALGASRRYIVFIIESEALLISLLGLVAGFVLSFAIGYAIHQVYGLFLSLAGVGD